MPKVDYKTLDPATTVVVATGNAHKVTEIEAILKPVMPGTTFYALGELGDFPDPVENGNTFTENAIIKAQAALDETGLTSVADDSGLVVDALGGEPGIMSARWAGVHGDDARNNAKMMREMADVPEVRPADLGANTCVVLLRPDGTILTGEGDCHGKIGYEPEGTHGFGYDPLFWPDDTPGRSMADLEPEEKNAISHRFHALQDLARQLA